MESPSRYWSGLYWDGIEPEQIGQQTAALARSSCLLRLSQLHSLVCRSLAAPLWHAPALLLPGAVELLSASGDGDAVVDAALTSVRSMLAAEGEAASEYFVSLMDMQQQSPKEDVAAADAAVSAPLPAPHLSLTSVPPAGVCRGGCLVLRLWPSAVFEGARESAQGNPGAKCRDVHFDPRTAQLRHVTALEETDRIMEQ